MKIKNYKLFLERAESIESFLKNDPEDIKYTWEDVEEFLGTDFNNGDVKIIFDKIESDSKLEIPKMYINFLLRENTGIDMESLNSRDGEMNMLQRGQFGTWPKNFEILKNHPCYSDLISAHKHTLEMLSLDENTSKLFVIKASREPWTSDSYSETAIYCEIHYELVNVFLNYVSDKLKHIQSYSSVVTYLELLEGKVDPSNETMVLLSNIKKRKEDESKFDKIYLDLIRYGFKYSNEEYKKLDLSKYLDYVESSKIFYVMCMIENFEEIENLRDFDINYLFYSGSSKGTNLGLEVLRPAFKKLMRTEWLWVEDEEEEEELALLFLLFDPKLLKTHIDGGMDKDFWLKIINKTYTHVAENLIAYNQKEAMEWLINLTKDGDNLKKFGESIKLFIPRIKSDFSPKKLGDAQLVRDKKMEKPDFDYFESKVKELLG